jgi:YbbR domain-containing protein
VSTLRSIIRAIEPHPGEHFKDKLIAVGLALLVWFAVNNEETVQQVFQSIPVGTVNLPVHLALAGEVEDTLTVWVNGPERDLDGVSLGRLSPEIDLSNAVAGENIYQILPEDLRTPSGVSITTIDPAQIRIMLEIKQQKSVRVAAVTSGEPAPGYEVVGRSTDPETAVVSGPRSLVEALEQVLTSTVDLSGRREPFTQTVTLAPGSLLELPEQRTVELRIEIVEQAINEQFDDIAVVVINNRFQVAVNPQVLGVVFSGPPSVLAELDVAQIRMVIDAEELEPRADDYLIEPTVEFDQVALGERVEVVALYPQRRINVHVFQQPARR